MSASPYMCCAVQYFKRPLSPPAAAAEAFKEMISPQALEAPIRESHLLLVRDSCGFLSVSTVSVVHRARLSIQRRLSSLLAAAQCMYTVAVANEML